MGISHNGDITFYRSREQQQQLCCTGNLLFQTIGQEKVRFEFQTGPEHRYLISGCKKIPPIHSPGYSPDLTCQKLQK